MDDDEHTHRTDSVAFRCAGACLSVTWSGAASPPAIQVHGGDLRNNSYDNVAFFQNVRFDWLETVQHFARGSACLLREGNTAGPDRRSRGFEGRLSDKVFAPPLPPRGGRENGRSSKASFAGKKAASAEEGHTTTRQGGIRQGASRQTRRPPTKLETRTPSSNLRPLNGACFAAGCV